VWFDPSLHGGVFAHLSRTGSTAGLRYSTKRTSLGAMHRVPSTLQDPSQPSLPCTTAWCVQRLGKSGITVGAQCKVCVFYIIQCIFILKYYVHTMFSV
jgi:hypothetical protein